MKIFKKQEVLGIDFGSSQIKIVEGRCNKKEIKISNTIEIDLPKEIYMDGEILDIEQLGYILGDGLRRNGIKAKKAIGVINSSKIIIREISLPKISHEEIKAILRYQVEDYIPIDAEDYIIEYLVIGKEFQDNVDKINLLLISIPKEIVETHFNLLKAVELEPQILDFQGNAIAKLMDHNNKINSDYALKNKTIASVDIGYHSLKVSVIKNGKIQISRVLDMGVSYIVDNILNAVDFQRSEIEKIIFTIFEQEESTELDLEDNIIKGIIDRSIKEILERLEIVFRYHLNRELSNSIDLILLQGGFASLQGIEEIFYDFYDIKTIKLESLDNINFQGKLYKYSNAIGALIRKEEVEI